MNLNELRNNSVNHSKYMKLSKRTKCLSHTRKLRDQFHNKKKSNFKKLIVKDKKKYIHIVVCHGY